MVYDINIFRKDVTRPLFTVGFLGLCLFLNFIKSVSEKEIKDIEEIIIKPYEQVFEIDITPKVSTKLFSLGGDALEAFMRFYNSTDKKNILNMKMETAELKENER